MSPQKTIVGIGEILLDKFPEYIKPGGAPCNVVYNASLLGNKGYLISATGRDDDGIFLRSFLNDHKISDEFVQYSPKHTGSVNISFIGSEAQYDITDNVAWDDIQWNDSLLELAQKTDAVCFSTLSQRNSTSRETLYQFLESVSKSCIKVLDVNLRTPYYSFNTLRRSFTFADIIKLNEAEYALIGDLFETKNPALMLMDHFNVKEVILTLGKRGSRYYTKANTIETKTSPVNEGVGDSVGVGDAFISCIIHHKLLNTNPHDMLAKANRYAGLVASQKGAMINIPDHVISSLKK